MLGLLTPSPAPSVDGGATSQKVEQFTLDNGLQVLVLPDRRAPTAVHMLWLRTGAMDEVDGRSGLAHMLEHMLFKGSKALPPGEFSRRVAALGGQENAFTSRDYTGYLPASAGPPPARGDAAGGRALCPQPMAG